MESLGFYCRFSSPSCRVNVKSYCGFLCSNYETTAFSVLEIDKTDISPNLGIYLLFEIKILFVFLCIL